MDRLTRPFGPRRGVPAAPPARGDRRRLGGARVCRRARRVGREGHLPSSPLRRGNCWNVWASGSTRARGASRASGASTRAPRRRRRSARSTRSASAASTTPRSTSRRRRRRRSPRSRTSPPEAAPKAASAGAAASEAAPSDAAASAASSAVPSAYLPADDVALARMQAEHTEAADAYIHFDSPELSEPTFPACEYWFVADPTLGLRTLGLREWPGTFVSLHRQAKKAAPPGGGGPGAAATTAAATAAGGGGASAAAAAAASRSSRASRGRGRPSSPIARRSMSGSPARPRPPTHAERVAARLHTGPMALKYNALLRSAIAPSVASQAACDELCLRNGYGTTLAALTPRFAASRPSRPRRHPSTAASPRARPPTRGVSPPHPRSSARRARSRASPTALRARRRRAQRRAPDAAAALRAPPPRREAAAAAAVAAEGGGCRPRRAQPRPVLVVVPHPDPRPWRGL